MKFEAPEFYPENTVCGEFHGPTGTWYVVSSGERQCWVDGRAVERWDEFRAAFPGGDADLLPDEIEMASGGWWAVQPADWMRLWVPEDDPRLERLSVVETFSEACALAVAAAWDLLDEDQPAEPEVEIDEDRHPVSDWQYEVANGDTRRGYVEWALDREEWADW